MHHSSWIRACAGLLLVAASMLITAALAAGIEVRDAHSSPATGMISVSANMNFEFSDEALEALENGVALHIVIEIQVWQKRRWLWNRTLASDKLRFKIQRQALSNYYLVTHLPGGEQHTFLSMRRALEHIGTLRDHPLMDSNQLQPDRHYFGRLRARLDIESLPAPLQPLAYISSGWRLASSWYEWPIEA
jgi:hypothetical protein